MWGWCFEVKMLFNMLLWLNLFQNVLTLRCQLKCSLSWIEKRAYCFL